MSRVVVSFAALVLALPAAAQQVEDRFATELGVQGGLTADEAARRASTTSYDVAVSLAELQASQAAATRARWSWLPQLALKGQYARLSELDVPPDVRAGLPPGLLAEDQYILQADLFVPVSDYVLRIPRLVSAAGKNEEASALSEKASRLTVASQARVAYWSWVGARLTRIVAEQTLEQTRSYLKDVEASTAAGVTSNADLLQARAQLAQAELGLARAREGAAVAEQQLATALHDPPGKEYAIGETLSSDVTVDTAGMDVLWDEARRGRLEVRSLRLAVEGLRQNASATRVQAWPQLAGFAGATYGKPNNRYIFTPELEWRTTWQAGGQITWAPTAVPQVLATAREVDAQASRLEAERGRLEDGLRVEVSSALNSYERARVALDSSQKQLAASEEAYRVRRLLFQNGRATGTEVTQALTDLTRARLAALSAQIELRVAAVQLTHALGRDVVKDG